MRERHPIVNVDWKIKTDVSKETFQKNIIDNPACEYGEIENTSHFFLHCNLYGQLRHDLLDRVSTYCQPTVNVFLYGNTDLTDVENVENAELLAAVQHYILKTTCFC